MVNIFGINLNLIEVFDISLLILFSLFIFFFLKRTKKKNLSREGIIFMYRTQVGVNAINWFGEKFKKQLHSIKYVIISLGFVLMGIMTWMLGQTLWLYISRPEITEVIKAPPIAPLIPYFPKIFGMSSIFPPFYFIYFIVALAIVAFVHEFSHGIFMKLYGVKIKSTGLVFLGPILGAFVEQEEKSFEEKSRTNQMTILAAGVFANALFALIFWLLYVGFFFSSFTSSGYIFTSYGITSIPLEDITGFEEMENNFTKVMTSNGTYYIDEGLSVQRDMVGLAQMIVYPEAPAILSRMKGAIIRADEIKIKRHEDLTQFLQNKNPGDVVTFVTEIDTGVTEEYSLTLGTHPDGSGRAYLGVGHNTPNPKGLVQNFLYTFAKFKDPSTFYKPSWDGDFVWFIYHFLWWVMIINLLVALFNMLPLGMLDGGRFFYLAVWGIFGKEKTAKRMFSWMTKLIILVFVLMMVFWGIRVF
jgi:membrane-associated protease RseP (regulator of RpoE activity)